MPVLKVYRHGLTAGIPPTVNSHDRAKRGVVGGWSNSSTRSNTRFLYSVEEQHLTGVGFALSLTLLDCPPTHDDWQATRRAFFKRLQRNGLIRAHWLTEWQRRGVPHLHSAVWLPDPSESLQPLQRGIAFLDLQEFILRSWLAVASDYRAGRRAQHIEGITDSVGWFKYLSKHAVRGVGHYQRSAENIPEGWKRTGRMWGYLGSWPLREAMKLEVSRSAYYAFRRLVRGLRVADARKPVRRAKDVRTRRKRIRSARRMLRCPDRMRSEVRGVSEWIELDAQLTLIAHLAAMGHEVQQV